MGELHILQYLTVVIDLWCFLLVSLFLPTVALKLLG